MNEDKYLLVTLILAAKCRTKRALMRKLQMHGFCPTYVAELSGLAFPRNPSLKPLLIACLMHNLKQTDPRKRVSREKMLKIQREGF